jgi:acetyl esterase
MKSFLSRCGLSTLLIAMCVAVQAQDNAEKSRSAKNLQGKNRQAKNATPKELEADKIEIYKSIDGVDLKAYVFLPKDHQATDHRPAMVFFFGGGWTNGSPGQFVEQCKHLAARGMVAITADYRVASRHGVKAVSCVTDAKSAIRWTRKNAEKLGIDPERIAAGGGSAGGHIAACTGLLDEFDEPTEDLAISSKPNAMALFNPALVLAEIEGESDRDTKRLADLSARLGVEPKQLSPFHHVGPNQPPTIIFHGIADTTVPYQTAEKFTAAMKAEGNDCELVGYESQGHGFFNFGRGDGIGYTQTLAKLDQFLERIGYLAK